MFRNKLVGKFAQSNESEQIDAIYFDSKKDQTLLQHRDTGKLTNLKKKHYVLVGQPHGEYLIHLTL